MVFSSPCSAIFLWITFFRDNNNPIYSLMPLFLINCFSTNKFPTRLNKNTSCHLDYGVILVMNLSLFWHWLSFCFQGRKDGWKEGKTAGRREGSSSSIEFSHCAKYNAVNKLQWFCFGQEFVSGSMEPAVLKEQFIAVQTEDICGK